MKHTFQKIATTMAMCLFMVLIGCQKDDEAATQEQSNKQGFEITTISFEEFKTHQKAYAEFEKAKSRTSTAKSREYGDGFYYETTEVSVLEYTDTRYTYKSYIFPIYRDTPTNYIENLLIWEKSTGETDNYIVEYHLTEQEKEAILLGEEVSNLTSKTFFIKGGHKDPPGIYRSPDGRCGIFSGEKADGQDYWSENIDGLIVFFDVVPCPESVKDFSFTQNEGGNGAPVVVYYPSNPGNGGSGPIENPGGSGGGPGGGFNSPVAATPLVDLPIQRLKEIFGSDAISLKQYPDLKLALFYCMITNPSEEVNNLIKKIKDFAFEDKPNNISIAVDILEYLKENNNSPESMQMAEEMVDLYYQDLQNDDLDLDVMHMTLETVKGNYLNQPFDANYYNTIDPYTEENLNSVDLSMIWYAYFTAQCAVLRHQNPGWSSLRVYWQASKEMIHIALDVVGLVPVVGEVADLTNGVIYTIEGDGLNATLSYASAIPVAGWAAAGVKFAKVAGGLTLIKSVGPLVSFGSQNSRKFRKLCGIAVGDLTKQAHHILPRASIITSHPVVQRATQTLINKGFHVDQAMNGIAVAAWRNQPNHNNYNNRIFSKLESFYTNNPNATPNQCYNHLQLIIQQAKTAIINNPNLHLNDLIF